jgi:hypothetical protein
MRMERMVARRLIALLLALLSACGGGSSSVVTEYGGSSSVVSVYGDSLTSGAGVTVKPAQRLQQVLGVPVADYSAPSMRAADALNGNPALPFTTFEQNMRETRPTVALILYGGADVIGGTDPAQFEADMRRLVALAQAVGARVVLATVINHPLYNVAPINAAIRRIAADNGCALAEVSAIPVGAFLDGIHPDQAYADARVAVIARAVPYATD